MGIDGHHTSITIISMVEAHICTQPHLEEHWLGIALENCTSSAASKVSRTAAQRPIREEVRITWSHRARGSWSGQQRWRLCARKLITFQISCHASNFMSIEVRKSWKRSIRGARMFFPSFVVGWQLRSSVILDWISVDTRLSTAHTTTLVHCHCVKEFD